MLDCYEFCTDECKKSLDGPREATKELEDRRVGLAKKAKVMYWVNEAIISYLCDS